jgi:succinyl-diaminopimelate desuccinylase
LSTAPIDSIVGLASRLVATPSCGGIDSPQAVLDLMHGWLDRNGLRPRRLKDADGKDVALLVELAGAAPGPLLCLDACIDTAPAGDRDQWTEPPFSGAVQGRRLLGRGAADSKSGVAILGHVARQLAETGFPRGALHMLFDADEHTGRFGGVRAYLAAIPRPPDGVSLGYPGNDCMVVGSRGFLRAKLHFAGRAAHSGEIEQSGDNALTKAAALALKVAGADLPKAGDAAFPFGPATTVTHLSGGEGFSVVPDHASCHIDIRLTRAFDGAKAAGWLEEIVHSVDGQARIETVDHWPAYLVEPSDRLVRSFAAAAEQAFGRPIANDVCGPSNIGNLLAARGVPTICAPGVSFANMHAANEWAAIDSIEPVYAMYCDAASRFLNRP